jgi:hypothetical protein
MMHQYPAVFNLRTLVIALRTELLPEDKLENANRQKQDASLYVHLHQNIHKQTEKNCICTSVTENSINKANYFQEVISWLYIVV